jgi:16S rRNA (guanine(1405)-N(7))-methyltransferase
VLRLKINQKEFNQKKIDHLVADIKKKEELSSLDDNFVKDHLIKLMTREARMTNQLFENFTHKSKEYREIVKLVRGDLRRIYGLFRGKKVNDHAELINSLLKNPTNEKLIRQVLETHSSTKERLSFYKELYPKIFSFTGKPKSIIDLGCGINPFSFNYMRLGKISYYAYDLSQDEINHINQYFKKIGIKGMAQVRDITNLEKLPKSDVCFLFKMTDMLDRSKGHKGTEEVLLHVPTQFVVVSFPTLTMSGKSMNYPGRRWIELLCERLEYEFKMLIFPNEMFYLIKKY